LRARLRAITHVLRYVVAPASEKWRSITLLLTAFAGSYEDFSGSIAIHRMKTRTTAISQTKTQALARMLASVTHGYTRVCMGTMPPERLSALAAKFDARYGICAHQRTARREQAGRARQHSFVAYAPPDEYLMENERLPWTLLATQGEGVETERWQDVRSDPSGSIVSCAGTMTPERCVGHGGERQRG
jgi:hypothetical protein